MRSKIWDMIWDLIPEEDREYVSLFEGCVVYEARVKGIADDIESLADYVELKIKEKKADA